MPQQPNIIASQVFNGEIHIFDYFKHPMKAESKAHIKPELKLVGYTEQGGGLSWSPIDRGSLASGSQDRKVSVWDVKDPPYTSAAVRHVQEYDLHKSCVRDVSWSKTASSLLASVGNGGKLFMYDTKSSGGVQFNSSLKSKGDFLSVDFNCLNGNYLATGSSDGSVDIWDMRKPSEKERTLAKHKKEVAVVTWSPHKENVLATASHDWNVVLWDIAQEAGNNIRYIHKGHKSFINDLAWSPVDDRLIASAGEDNILQLWQIGQEVFECSKLHLTAHVVLSLIHICRCRRIERCRSRWSPYH
eukprot:TRINITY_DN9909_c0_g2_i1.p1 TRINITY_DN9909_c0_g2~~TRINITY_DN9909_c0_g2_i1.p1  ORF type:complete len:301 (-),score=58.37 TRINITY_DN9909_c0_g2_i1:20-922(-)